MKVVPRFGSVLSIVALALLASWALARQRPNPRSAPEPAPKATTAAPNEPPPNEPAPDAPPEAKPGPSEPERVIKSDAEWSRILKPAEFLVLRRKATEPAFSGRFARGHFSGIFICAGCGAELFHSHTKFQSGTGWPSFYQPIDPRAVATAMDYSNPFEARVEVECHRCGGHLGHVFQDGPPPTGLRYCINSLALKLKPFPQTGKAPAPKGGPRSTDPPPGQPATKPTTKGA